MGDIAKAKPGGGAGAGGGKWGNLKEKKFGGMGDVAMALKAKKAQAEGGVDGVKGAGAKGAAAGGQAKGKLTAVRGKVPTNKEGAKDSGVAVGKMAGKWMKKAIGKQIDKHAPKELPSIKADEVGFKMIEEDLNEEQKKRVNAWVTILQQACARSETPKMHDQGRGAETNNAPIY